MDNGEAHAAASFVARDLLATNCVLFDTTHPFELTSGRRSPIYIDVRRLISFPKQRESIVLQLAARVQMMAHVDVVAGGETAGIPFAAMVAVKRRLPMVYVRKAAKSHGSKSLIEGVLPPDKHVALIEDLVSEGTSKVHFINTLRAAGAIVEHCFVIFNYNVYPAAHGVFTDHGVQLHALTTAQDVLRVATEDRLFTPEQHATLMTYFANPDAWKG